MLSTLCPLKDRMWESLFSFYHRTRSASCFTRVQPFEISPVLLMFLPGKGPSNVDEEAHGGLQWWCIHDVKLGLERKDKEGGGQGRQERRSVRNPVPYTLGGRARQ
jgi:hypothetical protein